MIFINPFRKYNERILIITGIAATLFGIILSINFHIVQDGIFDLHYATIDNYVYIVTALLNIIILITVSYFWGLVINRRTRLIDMLNVAMVSRIPIYVSMMVMAFTPLEEITQQVMSQLGDFTLIQNMQLSTSDILILMCVSVISLLLLAYFVLLFVNGFKIAVHATKWHHFLYCALSLVISEIITKIIYSILFT